MDNDQPLAEFQLCNWREQGFFILRELFTSAEIANLRSESERLLTEHSELISLQNLRCRYMPHHETGELLFEVFDPVSDISPVCAKFCSDRRVLSVIECLYGEPACLFKEKLIFKPPGSLGYVLHQDIPLAWNGFPRSFLTVLIPIDSSTEANGCTEVFSGYHREFLSKDAAAYMLPDDIVDRSRRECLVLNPGDIAIFHGLTPHRSEPNRSSQMRRVLYISYNALSEGGDQRAAHYEEFRSKLSLQRQSITSEPVYFR